MSGQDGMTGQFLNHFLQNLKKLVRVHKTRQVTITVVQENGERFKTLAKNVEV